MILKLPLETCAQVMGVRGASGALSFMASHPSFKAGDVASATGLSRKTVGKILKVLREANIVEKVGRAYRCTSALQSGGVQVNLRDPASENLFKPRKIRGLLLNLYFGEKRLYRIASDINASYRTVKRLLRKLRLIGLVKGLQISPDVLHLPEDPIENIPRDEHRLVVRELLSMLPDEARNFPLVLYGDANWGRPAVKLEFLVLVPAMMASEKLVKLMEKYVVASGSITESYGYVVDVAFAIVDAWLEQRLDMAVAENATVGEALRGICLTGKLPEKDDYFEILSSARPIPQKRVQELLKKGYLKHTGTRYVYTEKAIKAMRRKAPTQVQEIPVTVLNKKVRYIVVKKPETLI